MKDQFIDRLNAIALKKSIPFCYSCYKKAPTGRCNQCGSDDLARLAEGIGVEFGLSWLHKEILSDLETANLDERFEDMIRSCYAEETKLGWITVDTATAIREFDPVSWDLAKSEYIDNEECDGTIVSFDNGGNYFDVNDLDHSLTEIEEELGIERAS